MIEGIYSVGNPSVFREHNSNQESGHDFLNMLMSKRNYVPESERRVALSQPQSDNFNEVSYEDIWKDYGPNNELKEPGKMDHQLHEIGTWSESFGGHSKEKLYVFDVEEVSKIVLAENKDESVIVELKWFATGIMSYLAPKSFIDLNNVEIPVMPDGAVVQRWQSVQTKAPDLLLNTQPIQNADRPFMGSGVVKVDGLVVVKTDIRKTERLLQSYSQSQNQEVLKRKLSKIVTERGVEFYLRDYLSSDGVLSKVLLDLKKSYKDVARITLNGRNYDNVLDGG